MFSHPQYGTRGRIQDRETELDMAGFLEDIGVGELPSFDSDPGDMLESTALGSHVRQSPRRSPDSKIPRSPIRAGFLDESFHELMDDMGIDELPSFESETGTRQPTASARVPRPKAGPTMRRTELDMDDFLDEIGVGDLPSFDSDTSGRRLDSRAPGMGAQRTRAPVFQTPTTSRRIPMDAFLESPTGAEIEYAAMQPRRWEDWPEKLKETEEFLSETAEMLERYQTEYDQWLAQRSPQVSPRTTPQRHQIPHDQQDIETLLRETKEMLERYDDERGVPRTQISPRTQMLAKMYPSLDPRKSPSARPEILPYPELPVRPASPRRPPSPTPPMRPASPRRPPSRTAPVRPASPGRTHTRTPSTKSPRIPQVSSPKKRVVGPSPRTPITSTPYSRPPRQPVRTVHQPYEPEPGDLIDLYPRAYADYYDFVSGQTRQSDDDLIFFPEHDWTASEMETEKAVKLQEYEEMRRILQHVLRIIHPEVHYSNIEPPLVLLKALVRRIQEMIDSGNLLQDLTTKKQAKTAQMNNLRKQIQLMESNLQEASRYLRDITDLWNQKKGEYRNRVHQLEQQQGR
ncbi:uncharacterized protein [Parasteatoda tepidariorum]|uniref:uncharacterized protein n=1 Tax=Parasteatoda tepidariorum TaxID=114398 RepID=UPI001C71E675|nr:cell surface glycoprotein 1-like [Parasteatoda tepidariorum]